MPKPNNIAKISKPAWQKKVSISREDVRWLAAQNDSLFLNSGSGIEAVTIIDGKSLWNMTKGRECGTWPKVIYDKVFMPKGERSRGGLEMVDCQTGKRIGVFASGPQYRFEEMKIEGKRAVALEYTVVGLENQEVLFDDHAISSSFGDQVLWQLQHVGEQKEAYWVCTQIGWKRNKELWRVKTKDLGKLLIAYQDGVGIFYDTKVEKKKFPGHKEEVFSFEVRAVQLKGKKRRLWSQVMQGYGMEDHNGFPDILRHEDIILHGHEIYGAKDIYDTKPFKGVTAQNIRTGEIIWAKANPKKKWINLLAKGDGRFWLMVQSVDDTNVQQIVAVNATTGIETINIPIKGEVCVACEHQGMLAFIISNTLFCYNLTEL